MAGTYGTDSQSREFRCPDCRYPLKRRKARQVDECEMICGGCGQSFDVCDLETVDKLQDGS